MAIATPQTELDAVNVILSAAGLRPVNLIGSSVSPSFIAKAQIDTVSRTIQTNGFGFNTEDNVNLSQDVSGFINIPPNALKIFPKNRRLGLVQRGLKVYDPKNRTFDLSSLGTLYFKIVYCLQFDLIPEPTKTYITIRAARQYLEEQLGGVEVTSFKAQDEREAESIHNRYNDEFSGSSIFDGNLSMLYVTNREIVPRNV